MTDAGPVEIADTARLRTLVGDLAAMAAATDEAQQIERIRVLEDLRASIAAAQARETAAFTASRRAGRTARHPQTQHVERDIAGQVGLARRISPHRARHYVGFANVLTRELPETFAVLQRGETSEWRAELVARNTIFLSFRDRAEVDRRVAPHLSALGDKRAAALTRQHAYRLDPHGSVERLRAAEKDRRVTLRPAPDTMVRLGALVPVAEGVAAWAALRKGADAKRATGDPRTRGQLMADLLIERILGRRGDELPVEIELVMTDRTLLDPGDAAHEPAWLVGYGPLPARCARDLALSAPTSAPRWLRRWFRSPQTGELAAVDSRRRRFTAAQQRFIRIRDEFCRVPWCEAPISHVDHVRRHADGGPTSVVNAQGLCVGCNLTKEVPDWSAAVDPDGQIVIGTPTGHSYAAAVPRPPGTVAMTPVERFEALLRSRFPDSPDDPQN